MKRFLTATFALLLCLTAIRAAEPADTTGIIGRIESNRQLSVNQPEKLAGRLMPKRTATDATAAAASATEGAAVSVGGYRVQVYSGNNPRTARAEANARAEAIGAEFPEWATYVNFEAPYWRLKVGDFHSYEEAQAALSLLKKQFPSYGREMRLIRDRIKSER